MPTGWIITIIGHALFYIYILILNYFSSDQVYSEFRYWFNTSAILSQLIIFATDVFILKNVSVYKEEITLPKQLVSIWSLITCFSFVCIVVAVLYFEYTKAALFLMSLLWACSNIIIAFFKIYSPPSTALIHSNITLRVFRLMTFFPLVILALSSVLLISFKNLVVMTLISQLMFCIFMGLIIIKGLSKFEIDLIDHPTFRKSVLATFVTSAVGLLMLRMDVIFVYMFDVAQSYKFFDYGFIIIAICNTSSQILLRNAEAKVVTKEIINRQIILTSFLRYSYIYVGLIVATLLLAKGLEFDPQGLKIICVILAGYVFYFSFGPLLELRNLSSSSIKPLLLFACVTPISYITFIKFDFSMELRGAGAIAMNFILFRILHCIIIEKIMDYSVYAKRIPLAFIFIGLSRF